MFGLAWLSADRLRAIPLIEPGRTPLVIVPVCEEQLGGNQHMLHLPISAYQTRRTQ